MSKTRENNFIRDIYCNREYSWLQFNKRVLEQATDLTNPLLERCKFLAIFQSNLDEFFMVRVGSLINKAKLSPRERENKTGLTPAAQISGVLGVIKGLYRQSATVFTELKRELQREGVCLVRGNQLTARRLEFCRQYFFASLLPLLSPIVLDAKHPLPQLENKRIYLFFRLKKKGKERLGVMAVPDGVDRLFCIDEGKKTHLIAVEDILLLFAEHAFLGYEVLEKTTARVTRNADLDLKMEEDGAEADYSLYMQEKVISRSALGAVRLELGENSGLFPSFLQKELRLKGANCFKVRGYLDYKFLFGLAKYFTADRAAALRYPSFVGAVPTGVNTDGLIGQVQQKDLFLAYPFHTMDVFIRLLNECAEDERVLSIKTTIYRLDEHSRLIDALKRACEKGKEVVVVIELCARFDEENNLRFASLLREAGCTVLYGMGNYKVHSKILSIVLKEGDKIEYLTHLGTGNYNEDTARQYTDLNILTADRAIGEDAAAFFRNLAVCNTRYPYQKLLVAPFGLKTGLIACIDEQIALAKQGGAARIVMKMNSLTDKQLIDRLAFASRCGVKIDLLVRGICCLLPSVSGKTDNIRIRSIVGRFLEHSRVYIFGEGEERKIYISSADLMTRNTENRVEIAAPVLDKEIQRKISKMLDVMLADNVKAREILSDGGYASVLQTGEEINSQEIFLQTINEL